MDKFTNPKGADSEAATPLPELDEYDIIDAVGGGGMGLIYEAYQRSTGRRVAVKFLRDAAGASPNARRRFEREVELIARLQHPSIVSVLDSGVNHNRYFYVMDYVEGRTLDVAFADTRNDIAAAVRVMIQVCAAVDYAHQRGVLHRDLKPANILVGADGQPHVLDFGLGKAFDPEGIDSYQASLSEPGQLLGTLGYMSPEQARGQIEQTSVRSDVYSLGAILYELVTGQLPCSVLGPLAEVLTRIENQDPQRPSLIRRRRDADLDAILLKALEKEPVRRYATVAALADDLQRYVNNETISARRAGVAIRLARWGRRNRRIASVIGVSVALVGTVASISYRQVRVADKSTAAAELRQKALKQQSADRIGQLLDVLQRSDRSNIDVEAVVQALVQRTRTERADDPEAQAYDLYALGNKLREWNYFALAEPLLSSVVSIRQKLVDESKSTAGAGAFVRDLADAHLDLGYVQKLQGQSKYPEALRHYQAAIELRTQAGDRRRRASDLTYVAKLYSDWGKFAEAQQAYDQSLAYWRDPAPDPPDRLELTNILNNKALMMMELGNHHDAEAILRNCLRNYLNFCAEAEHDGADEAALDRFRGYVAQSRISLANCLTKLAATQPKRLDEAETLCRAALDEWKRLYPESKFKNGHQSIVGASMALAEILLLRGQTDEAELLLRKAVETCDLICPTHPKTPVVRSMLGDCLIRKSRFPEAETLLLKSFGEMKRLRGDSAPETRAIGRKLADLYLKWGRFDQFARYREYRNDIGENSDASLP